MRLTKNVCCDCIGRYISVSHANEGGRKTEARDVYAKGHPDMSYDFCCVVFFLLSYAILRDFFSKKLAPSPSQFFFPL